MKVTVQEKIAELEGRIKKLEDQANQRHEVVRERTVLRADGPFGEHWRKMWVEFELAMKELF